MRFILMAAGVVFCAGTPALATECAQHIQAIERRMHSSGASQVTGEAPSAASKSQAWNAAGKAPAPTDGAQQATPDKMKQAETLLAKAKDQEKAGDKEGCEGTMQQVQMNMGAVP